MTSLIKLLKYILLLGLLANLAITKLIFNITKKTKTEAYQPSTINIFRQRLEQIPLLSYDLPLIQIDVGTPGQKFEVLLETASLETWVPLRRSYLQNPNFKQFFNHLNSLSFRNLSEHKIIFHRDGYINGTHGLESIYISNTGLTDFHMYFADNAVFIRDIEYNGILAMGNFNGNNSYARQFSFLQNLYEQSKIDRRVFAIEYFNYYNSTNDSGYNSKSISRGIKDDLVKGVLTIGSIPDSILDYQSRTNNSRCSKYSNFLDNFTYEGSPTNMNSDLHIYKYYNNRSSHYRNTSVYGECNIINYNNILYPENSTATNPNNLWTCNLKYMYFPHENSLVSKLRKLPQKNAIFDSGINGIYIPYSIFEKYFTKIYLKDLLDKRQCKMSRYLINCQSDLDISKLSPVYLNFGNFTAKLNPADLFKDVSQNGMQYKIFQIMVSMLDEDLFLIGTPMLNKFITVFDWDNQRMGFYGEDISIDEPVRESKLSNFDFYIIWGLILILLVFTLIGLISSRKRGVSAPRDSSEPLNRDFRGFNVIPNEANEERKENLDNIS